MQLRSISSFACAFGLALAIFGSAGVATAAGVMRITEWMYNGDEFIEFTNVGDASIDLKGWSFDDDSRLAGTVSLSAFGLVDVGESVILSEFDAVTFRAAGVWICVGRRHRRATRTTSAAPTRSTSTTRAMCSSIG